MRGNIVKRFVCQGRKALYKCSPKMYFNVISLHSLLDTPTGSGKKAPLSMCSGPHNKEAIQKERTFLCGWMSNIYRNEQALLPMIKHHTYVKHHFSSLTSNSSTTSPSPGHPCEHVNLLAWRTMEHKPLLAYPFHTALTRPRRMVSAANSILLTVELWKTDLSAHASNVD